MNIGLRTTEETLMTKNLITPEQQEQIKRVSWEKISATSLLHGCSGGDSDNLRGLFAGYWYFVDNFPGVIRATYEASARFSKYGRVLSGALLEMETDERNHRTLWIKSADAASISEAELYASAPLPEVQEITTSMLERASLWQRLLDFVAVEIVAEGISVYLLESERFEARMGKKGIGWFNVHSVHPADQTSHEDIAYRAAQSMMPAGTAAFATINETIQETVDRFVVASYACYERYCAAPSTG
jgi:pyrroloquinoline quinone (PQQ) biosynthesis protein C